MIAAEFSHVFCCVLPTVVTVLSFGANLGLVTAAPTWLLDIHEKIHDLEVPIILASGAMVCFGWAFHSMSLRVDCHNTGCSHPPCTPSKNNNRKILLIATILFLVNVTIYTTIHKNIFGLSFIPNNVQHEMHNDEHADHDHDHH